MQFGRILVQIASHLVIPPGEVRRSNMMSILRNCTIEIPCQKQGIAIGNGPQALIKCVPARLSVGTCLHTTIINKLIATYQIKGSRFKGKTQMNQSAWYIFSNPNEFGGADMLSHHDQNAITAIRATTVNHIPFWVCPFVRVGPPSFSEYDNICLMSEAPRLNLLQSIQCQSTNIRVQHIEPTAR